MPAAGSPATPLSSSTDRRLAGGRLARAVGGPAVAGPSAGTLDRFLAEGARRRRRHTEQEPQRPADWADPDPAAILQAPGGTHPLELATRRLRNDKCRADFLGGVRRACTRLQGVELGTLTDEDVRAYPWHHVDPDRAADYRRLIYATFPRQTTRNDYVSRVRRVMIQVCKAGLISPLRRDLVLEQLWTVAVGPSSKRRRLTQAEIDDLLAACERMGGPRAGARNTAIVATFRTSGMRISELCHLQLADWDRQQHTLLLRDTKNGKQHLVYLHPDAIPYLQRWLQHRGTEPGALFGPLQGADRRSLTPVTIRYMLSTRAQAAGVAPFGSHDFRRTFATELLRRHDVALVGKLLNHTKTASTLIYDLAGEEEMRAAVADISLPDMGLPDGAGSDACTGTAHGPTSRPAASPDRARGHRRVVA